MRRDDRESDRIFCQEPSHCLVCGPPPVRQARGKDRMETSIFAFVRRYSTRQQLYILLQSLASLPILYVTLDLPKTIINKALSGSGPYKFYGFPLDQITYLYTLCGFFLVLVLVGGVLKYVTNVYVGVVSERMLRRLRYQLYQQVMRFPLPHLRRVSQGELVQLINAETEPLGGFVGDALSVPAIQGGTLLTTLLFMFMQDYVLGLAAVALYPLQLWLIPKLQAQVNRLGKLRVRQVRKNAERISEMAQSVRDIRANDATWRERARFSEELGQVYDIRFIIYKKKFLIKFLNNFIAQLGPFFFFSIGGYLVLQGQITIGALVAVVAAQKDMASPWKELLTYYQNLYDVKIKYEQTIIQFLPPGLRDPKLQDEAPEQIPALQRELRVSGVVVRDDDEEPLLDGISFTLSLPTTLAILGPAGSGKEELTLVLAGLLQPHAGRVTVDGQDLASCPKPCSAAGSATWPTPRRSFPGPSPTTCSTACATRPVIELAPEIAAERARYRFEVAALGQCSLRSYGRMDGLGLGRSGRPRGAADGHRPRASARAAGQRRLHHGPTFLDQPGRPSRRSLSRGTPNDARAPRRRSAIGASRRAVRPRALQQQRHAGGKPAVRCADRQRLRSRATGRQSLCS